MNHQSHVWVWILLFVCFVWGIEFSLVHQAVEHMGPNTFNALRFFIAVLSLLLWLLYKKQNFAEHLSSHLLWHGVVLGTLLYLGFISQTVGLQYTTASNAGFITGLNCVLVPVISRVWLHQLQAWYVWLGVGLATCGTFLLTGGVDGFATGEMWVLVCAVCFASHIVYTGVYVKNSDALILTLVQLITVTVLSLITALIIEQDSLRALPDLLSTSNRENSVIWLALIIGGVLGTAFAYVAQTAGQQVLAAWRVALIFSSEPLFAALGGYLLLSEALTTLAWIGALLIIAGVLVAELVGSGQESAEL